MSRKKNLPTIRSSAAEYLTFIAASGQGGVEAVYADEDVWLSQKMMGELYGVNGRFKYEVQHGLTRRETPRGVS